MTNEESEDELSRTDGPNPAGLVVAICRLASMKEGRAKSGGTWGVRHSRMVSETTEQVAELAALSERCTVSLGLGTPLKNSPCTATVLPPL